METNQHAIRCLAGEISGIYVEMGSEYVGMCGVMPIAVNAAGDPPKVQHWCFLDIINETFREKYSTFIALNMMRSVKALRAGGLDAVYTFLDLRIPKSQELLEKLGFEPLPVREKTAHIVYTEERWGKCWWKRL